MYLKSLSQRQRHSAKTVSLDTSDRSDGVDKYDSHLIFPFNMESLMKDIRVILS